MFTLQETLWQLSRNRVRTIILLLATALLARCTAFYLGSLRAIQEAFERLVSAAKIARSFRIDPIYLLSAKNKGRTYAA